MPTFSRFLLASVSLLTVVALAPCAATATATAAPPSWAPFAPDSVFNTALRDDAPLSPDSAAQVDWLTASNTSHGMWINSSSCGMPIYWAEADTPRVAVRLDHPSYMDPALIRAWSSVPIPADARPANCGDRNFAVLQTQLDGTVSEWEFWAATQGTDGRWTAKWGGATQDVMADRGTASTWQWRDASPPPLISNVHWNVTASSLSMIAGVITIDEVNNGAINHAIGLALFDAAGGRWSWPAQRTDGASADPAALLQGGRLRLDPSLDLDALTMTPLVRMMAEAAQRYGIIVRDKTYSANVFFTEQPHFGQANPFPGLLAGKAPSTALAAFPWSHLQVLDSPECTVVASCTVPPEIVISVDTPTPRVGEAVQLDTSNSVLEHPRTLVEWDLDGDGTYETPTGRALKTSYVPGQPGTRRVGLRVTMRDAAVSTGEVVIDVAGPRQAVVRRPSAVRRSLFASYGGNQTALGAISALTAPPAVPDRYRKLYSGSSSGNFDVDFGGEALGTQGAATLNAWVECSAARCLRLQMLDAAGTVVGSADPPHGVTGWASVRVPGPLSSAQIAALHLRGTVRTAVNVAGNTSISAVSLAVDPG